MVPEEDKVKRIQKKNSWDQGIIWPREDRLSSANPQYEKTKVFAKKLPLNSMFKEALAKLKGNHKPVYSTPSVT